MKRTRWAGRLAGGLLAVASANGCKQQLFQEPADYRDAAKGGASQLDLDPVGPVVPGYAPGPAPATVLDPTRPARNLRLPEAIAIALENGGTGGFAATNPGFGSEQLATSTGRGTQGSDSIRAFALDPAVAAAEVERALSKFDARWINSITWNKVDQPVINFQQSFQNGDTAQLVSTLAKPLPTGGVAGITFSTNYQRLSNPPTGNQIFALPVSYTPSVQFSFEQPLFQGFGVEINQLLPNHPGTQLLQGLRPSGGQGSEGILITRIRLDQQRTQFDEYVNQQLLNVEAAYWTLVAGYYNLQAQEEGLKQSLDSYLYYRARADRGLNREQVALQALDQYYQFANQVVQARGTVLENERQLRLILGLRSDDGTRLVPVDDLIRAAFTPDYAAAVADAMAYRPSLLVQRQEVKARQLNVLLQKNLRRPDVRFLSQYSIAGVGTRLDGSNDPTSPNRNALASLESNQFTNWTLGIRADIPIGFRDANALVRQADLGLQQEVIRLQLAEEKVGESVAQSLRNIVQFYEQAKLNRSSRVTQEKFVELDQQIRVEGAISREEAPSFVLNLIQSQQRLAAATAAEAQALAQYNISLARLEYAKGTIQAYNRIVVAEGALPAHVGKKAADHFSAREAALKLREHPADGPAGPAFVRQAPLTDAAIQGAPAAVPEGYTPPKGYDPGANPLGKPAAFQPKPAEAAPAPQPQPAPAPTPAPAGSPIGQPVPRVQVPLAPPAAPRPLLPADAPAAGGTFSPVGTVTLPTRGAPAAPPTTPVAVPVPPR